MRWSAYRDGNSTTLRTEGAEGLRNRIRFLARTMPDAGWPDLSEAALQSAQARMGEHAASVRWIAADATDWQPPGAFDIWHDRAAFHFLVEPEDRAAYIDRLHAGVKPGGHAIIATFAPDGPEKCSGLPVRRYDSMSLSRTIGEAFELVEQLRHHHVTPWGAGQSFQYSVLRRR